MKRFVALLLALVMILSLSATAFADEVTEYNSITINNAKPGETYNLYKLFDLSVDLEKNAYTYTVNEDWVAFFTGEGAGAQYVTINAAGAVTFVDDVDVAALAKAAAEWTGKPKATQSITVKDGENTAAFTGLADGYWLITSSLGTIAMTETTPDKNEVEFEEKNPEDTITKTVKEDSNGLYGESNDAQIGDKVEFKSVVTIVKGTRNVVVHDKMDSGLTYTANSVAIKGLTKGTEYTVNESPTDGDTFDITFAQSWIDGLDFGADGFETFEITYTATLNENAVKKDENGVAIVDQNNKTHVTFGDKTSSEEDTTTTTTHSFSVFKHAKDSTDNLAGAVFSLKKAGTVVKLIKLDDNNYRVANGEEKGAEETFITVADGDIVIWGVDADNDYTLEEKTPPDGYNKLTAEVPVTVNANNTTRVDVVNNAGTELPSTGGVGTTLFYVFGGILVLASFVLLVTKKRMAEMA